MKRKTRYIKTEWIFTKDLKDRMIIMAPHDIRIDELPKGTRLKLEPIVSEPKQKGGQ